VSALKTCEVSYRDHLGVKHSVEVTAQSLYEAAALGSKLLKVGSLHHVTFEVRVKEPEKKLELSGALLAAWLARPGKNPKQQALKARLHEIVQGGSSSASDKPEVSFLLLSFCAFAGPTHLGDAPDSGVYRGSGQTVRPRRCAGSRKTTALRANSAADLEVGCEK
jgi:hypothetical protein